MAVAIGGATALSACLSEANEPVPRGTTDRESLPSGQHQWNRFLSTDSSGNHTLPRHHLLFYLTLTKSGIPTQSDRSVVESALRTIETAYAWRPEGLLFSLGFSPHYFDRYPTDLPTSVDLPSPRALSDFESPTFDTQDMLLHMASDRPDVLLTAEEALFGDRDTVNTISIESRLSEVCQVDDRRSGFVGPGMPANRQDGLKGIPDSNPVPESSPLFMGFKTGFRNNQAAESDVEIQTGPFAGGTTKHVSRLRMRLDDWYQELDHTSRVAKMFSPTHAQEEMVPEVGNSLGTSNGITDRMIETIRDDAKSEAVVGHAQKAARGNRRQDGSIRLLRRHFESTDDNEASLHFPSLQAAISEFEMVRKAMNGGDITDIPTIRQRVRNGILEYAFVTNRGNFLIPLRGVRALPRPDGSVEMR
jgi:hypothetical protein